jgi:hypothetical protein
MPNSVWVINSKRMNKHNHFIYLLFASVIVAFISCNKESAPDCFKRAGQDAQVVRELDFFSRIETKDFIHIELKEWPTFQVEIRGPENILPKIKTAVEDEILFIENENTCNFVRSFNRPITVRIYAPQFTTFIHNGTGDIRIVDTLQGPSFFLENNDAAGIFSGHIECDTLVVISHTGVSDVNISGSVKRLELFSQGLGRMDASALRADVALINNSSINDVSVWAEQYLFAFIGSKGNIFYAPTQADIDPVIEGTGQVEPF